MQIRLQTLGHLSSNFLSYGKFDKETENAIVKFKEISNLDDNSSTINDDVWLALGLPLKKAYSEFLSPPSENEIQFRTSAESLAIKRLDNKYYKLQMAKDYNGTSWNIYSITIRAQSWAKFQDVTSSTTLGKLVAGAIDTGFSLHNNYKEASSSVPPQYAFFTAVAFEIIGRLLNEGPSISSAYNQMTYAKNSAKITKATENLDAVSSSPIGYAVTLQQSPYAMAMFNQAVFETAKEIIARRENKRISEEKKLCHCFS